ncbi:hypothetical protein ABZ491_28685 [Micromonospora rifamycinica]|uniref:hypothetical protein n=1 Tax=Micromonospora rifamycinica TaxID=291594 RepID=UPI0034212416
MIAARLWQRRMDMRPDQLLYDLVSPDVVSAIGSISSSLIAVIAAIIAFFAWRTSVNAAESNKALTVIEKARWHADNRPEFLVEAEGLVEDNRLAACSVTFIDSKSLAWVDVVASIRHRKFGSDSDLEDPGPYQWDPMSEQFESPLKTKQFRLYAGADATLWMEAATSEEWHRYTRPIRLWLHCTAENGDTWLVPASCRLTPVQLVEGIITREQIEAESEIKWGPG